MARKKETPAEKEANDRMARKAIGCFVLAILLLPSTGILTGTPALLGLLAALTVVCAFLNSRKGYSINRCQKMGKIQLVLILVFLLPPFIYLGIGDASLTVRLMTVTANLLFLLALFFIFPKRWQGKRIFASGDLSYELTAGEDGFCNEIELVGEKREQVGGLRIKIRPETGIAIETSYLRKTDSLTICPFNSENRGRKVLLEASWTKDDREVVFFIDGQPRAAYGYFKERTGWTRPELLTPGLEQWKADPEKLGALAAAKHS